jgi:adenylate kinase
VKTILFGQIGLRKKRVVEELERFATAKGKHLKTFHVGQMMYESDDSIKRGHILQKDPSELKNIRARVWDRIVHEIERNPTDHYLINTHSTFRWENGLFVAFSKQEIQRLNPDLCITLIDDVQDIKYSLGLRANKPERFTLKDIIVWREEEILAADFASQIADDCFNYVVARDQCPELLFKLIFEPQLQRAYLSYPISLVRNDRKLWQEIESFRKKASDCMICFDPIAIDEGNLVALHQDALRSKHRKIVYSKIMPENKNIRLELREIEQVIPNINGQIVARDFRLIEQSNIVVAYIPVKANKPQISIGVERELAHAQRTTIDTYVIWRSSSIPSPFQKATKTFGSIDECISYVTN